MSAKNALLLTAIEMGLAHAKTSGEWVVLCCPTKTMRDHLKQMAMAMFPDGTVFGGRTARLPRGRFSVVASTDDRFTAPEVPLTLLFEGWSEATEPQLEGMRQWKGMAKKVLVETGRADQAIA